MKKWLLISALTLGLIGGGAGMAYSQTDEASTTPSVQTPAVTKSRAKISVNASKQAKAPAAPTRQQAASVKPAPQTASETKPTAAAANASSAAAKPAAQSTSQQATGLAAYYGTWHNAAVTLTLSGSTMTVAQSGQSSITTTYRAVPSGAGYLFTPTDVEADSLLLVLSHGQLQWVTGASAPLILVR
ncbi:superantigen-like protein SSL4 [Lacticaseibacillus hegangensis]|uniref:Serine/threonine protein kinase n=1 Tax=Lacticaseibacillus hegangensis TaxID=2486010 RepID=A0ABW4CV14_9LACO|nr:hypothetical protein [Lacticaseibacillus hegangensis]